MSDSFDVDRIFRFHLGKAAVTRATGRLAGFCRTLTNLSGLLIVITLAGFGCLWIIFPDQVRAYEGEYAKWAAVILQKPSNVILSAIIALTLTSILNSQANRLLRSADLYLLSESCLYEWCLAKMPDGISDPEERDDYVEKLMGPRLRRIFESYEQTGNYYQALLSEEFPVDYGVGREDAKRLPDPSNIHGYLAIVVLSLFAGLPTGMFVIQLMPITQVILNLP